MMRLSLLAATALALSGVTAGMAQATVSPELFFKVCKKVTAGTGEFEKSNCEGAAGTKEFKAEAIPAEKALPGRSTSGITKLYSKIGGSPITIECKKDQDLTFYLATGLTKTVIVYEECKITEPATLAEDCTVPLIEAFADDILVYEMESSKALDLFKPGAGNTNFAEITFGTVTGKTCSIAGKDAVKGTVLAKVAPESKYTEQGTVTFTTNAGHTEQVPNEYAEKNAVAKGAGTKTALTFAGEPAFYESTDTTELLSKEFGGVF